MPGRKPPTPPPIRRWQVDHLYRDTGDLVTRIVEGTVDEMGKDIAAKTTSQRLEWQPAFPIVFTTEDGPEIQVRELPPRPGELPLDLPQP